MKNLRIFEPQIKKHYAYKKKNMYSAVRHLDVTVYSKNKKQKNSEPSVKISIHIIDHQHYVYYGSCIVVYIWFVLVLSLLNVLSLSGGHLAYNFNFIVVFTSNLYEFSQEFSKIFLGLQELLIKMALWCHSSLRLLCLLKAIFVS